MNNPHIGSNFDDFLAEEGILAEVEAAAIKQVLAYQLIQEMERANLTRTELANRMNTSRASVNRLLDPQNVSVTLQTLERAALAVGKKLRIELA
ncbi:MAG: XRE family transcriptional regulator [Caldilineaceae bacterium]